jgi:hypothetical protein
VTVVEAPPQRQPSQEELEALIEEARRRTRRRRLVVGGAVVGAIGVAGLVVGLVLVLRGGTGTAVPRGFHLVRARGPVRHLQLEDVLGQPATLDVATGDARRTRVTQELWWNERTGFVRTVYREDGRVVSDWVEQQCQGTGASRFCTLPWPYIPYQQLRGPNQQPKPGAFRRAGTGTFRGHRVVWIETIYRPEGQKPSLDGDQVAYDAVTDRPIALRTIDRSGRFKGRTFSYYALKLLPDLPPGSVSFVVPDGGAGRNTPNPLVVVTGRRLDAAFAALGKTPLWLGRSFDGHRLTSVVTGRDGAVANGQTGRMLRPARFARFDYGSFSLKEFGQDRPWWYEQDPPAGKVVLTSSFAFARDGVLVTVTVNGPKVRLDRAKALELVRALRPVARS